MNRIIRIKNAAGMQMAIRAGEECVKKAYNFLEVGADELEVNMYGEVVETVPVDWWTGKPVEGMYICEKEFLDELEKYKTKSRITLRINSVGGDLYAGMAIANRLAELDAEIITVADALCASAAVAIFLTGSTRKVFGGSQIMIHEPSCYIHGRYDVQGIKKVQRSLEAGKKAIIRTYEERTGRSEEDLERMITQDCWMTGQEAIDEGFADELIEGEVSAEITEDKKVVVSNGISFPAEVFDSLPKGLKVIKNAAGTGRKMPSGIENHNEGGEEQMTAQELKEKFPDVYNEIIREAGGSQEDAVSKAVEAERKRIQEIDEIANQVGDERMVEDAKFGEKPLNASELALMALRQQRKMGERFLSDSKKDTEESGTDTVKPAPNAGTKNEEEQSIQDIMDGAALIAGSSRKEKE